MNQFADSPGIALTEHGAFAPGSSSKRVQYLSRNLI